MRPPVISQKERTPQLYDAVQQLLSGGRAITEPFREMLTSYSKQSDATWSHHALSVYELGVLSLLARGRTVSQVAQYLRLSVKTVSTYRTRLLEKLCLRTTADLIRYAVYPRLVP
ncbi:MAG TPA: LuxR C-terminal-related transcriptional regulator [Nitrospira sp.]|nr:LuxR C-terminal-related transcriptional regulator [Nitrospira sp.]